MKYLECKFSETKYEAKIKVRLDTQVIQRKVVWSIIHKNGETNQDFTHCIGVGQMK